jgi:Family of unknown function (DUF6600)/FecR protein
MGQSFGVALAAVASIVAFSSPAYALNDPPSQVGRLAFTEGTVSFHDDQQTGWSPAAINTPLTSGDSLWTEPNARSEISVAGTRVRMGGGTQLDMLAIDDSQTRLQVAQGRVDIKTYSLDPNVPYQVVTPRGTVSLRQQGDYYVEAGSTQDATRLGVRSGAAQIQSLNGQTLTVRPGQVGEIYGDAGTPQLRTINSAPPAMPASWAARDRQVNYDLPAQYLSAGVTGYEDLGSYGSWSNDSQYGNVWTPRAVPSGWQPYKTGHWSYVQPWGWTWVDDQPWGYAPYHYGRWANIGGRWVWVPPQRETAPVYAPALVAFIGGIELALGLGNQNNAPVGWFPLGPREVYVPSYTTDQNYYTRINRSNQIQQQVLDDRWQRAQRRETYIAAQNAPLVNQRFATVVPSEIFVRSQPVARAALPVSAAQIAAAPVAPVSAPPAPTASVATVVPATAPTARTSPAATPPAATATTPATPDPKAEADAKAKADAQMKAANVPVATTAVAAMPTLAKPAATATPTAPGPKVAATQPTAPTGDKTNQAVPALAPRQGAAPPELKGAIVPAPAQPAKPGEPPKQQQATPQPQATPPAVPAPAPQQAKPEPAKPAESSRQRQAAPQPQAAPPAAPTPAPQQAKPEPAKPADLPKVATPPAAQPAQPGPQPGPRPAETRPSPQNDNKAPDKGANLTPQRPAPAPAPAATPPQPPTPKAPSQAQAPAPQPQPQAHPAPQPAPAAQQKPDDKKDEKK